MISLRFEIGGNERDNNTVGFIKIAMIQGSIMKGEGDFRATFRVKTGQFTWHCVAS